MTNIPKTAAYATMIAIIYSILSNRNLDSMNLGCFKTPTLYRSKWWTRQGSNLRPSACKAASLPTEILAHKIFTIPNSNPF